MRTIATICARGGSVGVPDKNVRLLAGRPLIAHTIEQALACPVVDAVYVSTDSDRIAAISRAAGATVPYRRPAELATASAPKIPVIAHLVEHVERADGPVDRIIDLQPTSPLREVADIEACLGLLDESTDVVFTGCEAESNPYFSMVEARPDGSVGLVKPPAGEVFGRHAAPAVYAMNGAVYAWHRRTLSKGLWGGRARIHLMPRERSIDIDTELDFRIAEMLMRDRIAAAASAA